MFNHKQGKYDQLAHRDRVRLGTRFWPRVTKGAAEDDCWIYSVRSVAGYGNFHIAKVEGKYVSMSANRFSLILAKGLPGPGMQSCHRCPSRRCVNPGHLYWGSSTDNVSDCVLAGNQGPRKGEAARGESNGKSKMTEKMVMDVARAYSRTKVTCAELAKLHKVHENTINMILSGRTWSWLTGISLRNLGAAGDENRKSKIPEDVRRKIPERLNNGESCAAIAKQLKVSYHAVYAYKN